MNDPSEATFDYYTTETTNNLTGDDANIQHQLGWNRPCRVGLFSPSKLGLYDMHGNVFEWCDDEATWRTPGSRLMQGGGWNDAPTRCRLSNIEAATEPWLFYDLGLRVARVPVEQ